MQGMRHTESIAYATTGSLPTNSDAEDCAQASLTRSNKKRGYKLWRNIIYMIHLPADERVGTNVKVQCMHALRKAGNAEVIPI
jgi:hypothetical protein